MSASRFLQNKSRQAPGRAMASEEPPPGAPGAYAWIGELSKQGEDAVALEGVIHGNRQLGATIFLLFDEQSKDKSVAHICSFGWNL